MHFSGTVRHKRYFKLVNNRSPWLIRIKEILIRSIFANPCDYAEPRSQKNPTKWSQQKHFSPEVKTRQSGDVIPSKVGRKIIVSPIAVFRYFDDVSMPGLDLHASCPTEGIWAESFR